MEAKQLEQCPVGACYVTLNLRMTSVLEAFGIWSQESFTMFNGKLTLIWIRITNPFPLLGPFGAQMKQSQI